MEQMLKRAEESGLPYLAYGWTDHTGQHGRAWVPLVHTYGKRAPIAKKDITGWIRSLKTRYGTFDHLTVVVKFTGLTQVQEQNVRSAMTAGWPYVWEHTEVVP